MTENKDLIIDTGFFLALFSKKDQFHKQSLALKSKINSRKWITTWPVVTEVCYLLSDRESNNLVSAFLQLYELGGYDIFPITKNHILKIKSLLEKYSSLPMDLADASLVILAENLGHGDIVSTDLRDFDCYRWKNHKPFHNLFKI